MKFILKFLLVITLFYPLITFPKDIDNNQKVYDSVIYPILDAKCINCHGAEKDKGKLRMHTKEDLLKGGRGAGSDIIVKQDIEASELIYRITLPKEDEESMPPMEDEAHYNPVTEEELMVLKSWINLGASFDMLLQDLDDVGKKAADHVLNNLPKKMLSATALLIPRLPEVPAANQSILSKLKAKGLLVMPIAQNTNALYLNASYLGKKFNDEELEAILPLAPQLLWLNVARTSISDNGMKFISKLKMLERLHAENTSISDASTPEISKLGNLKYLNLYNTKISDASIENLRKLQKLEKVFLWQTKVTQEGAEALRHNFVDSKIFTSLSDKKNALSDRIKKTEQDYAKKINELENKVKVLSSSTDDQQPINDKCPVSNKPVDISKSTNFEGRMVGFCCANCKGKFDKDSASYRSKITNFEPSSTFTRVSEQLIDLEKAKDNELEKLGLELRNTTSEIKNMGPEINLGWIVGK